MGAKTTVTLYPAAGEGTIEVPPSRIAELTARGAWSTEPPPGEGEPQSEPKPKSRSRRKGR